MEDELDWRPKSVDLVYNTPYRPDRQLLDKVYGEDVDPHNPPYLSEIQKQ